MHQRHFTYTVAPTLRLRLEREPWLYHIVDLAIEEVEKKPPRPGARRGLATVRHAGAGYKVPYDVRPGSIVVLTAVEPLSRPPHGGGHPHLHEPMLAPFTAASLEAAPPPPGECQRLLDELVRLLERQGAPAHPCGIRVLGEWRVFYRVLGARLVVTRLVRRSPDEGGALIARVATVQRTYIRARLDRREEPVIVVGRLRDREAEAGAVRRRVRRPRARPKLGGRV